MWKKRRRLTSSRIYTLGKLRSSGDLWRQNIKREREREREEEEEEEEEEEAIR